MRAFEINTDLLVKQFHELPAKIYKDDPNWTTQIGADVEHMFDPRTNSLLEAGEIKRWIIYNELNMPAGRIAAFFNHERTKAQGGIGFFECINDTELASSLLGEAVGWLQQNDCVKIEAPINFGEKDRFWGLLTMGFHTPGLYLDNYNPAYYESLLTDFGMSRQDCILTYRVPLDLIPEARLRKVTERLTARQSINFRQFNLDKVSDLAADLHHVYINSFEEQNRIRYLSIEDIKELIVLSRPVLEDRFIWMAYKDEKPIALLAFMKDLNPDLRRLAGKPNLPEKNLKGFAFSVVPEFRGRGIELGLCYYLQKKLKEDENQFCLYFSGVNDKSSKMLSFLDSLNGKIIKKHHTFSMKINR